MKNIASALKFHAPDGKAFESKVEFRNYVTEKFYSFKNKEHQDQLIKYPGDIDGQGFEISDCKYCTIVIMDIVEQTYITDLINCKVFIGACSSSLFIRNCLNCIFYTCSRQLRINNVVSSIFYSYTPSEIHIEFSNLLQFAPFLGGYEKQIEHFQKIGLSPYDNLWYDIYDHHDPSKLQMNWKLLPKDNYEKPWYPTGTVSDSFITLTIQPSKITHKTTFSEQSTGESFGLDQMISDAKKQVTEDHSFTKANKVDVKTTKVVPNSKKKIPIESALLIITAENQSIDLNTWFNMSTFDGKMKLHDFIGAITSLSTTMSLNQSRDTKNELDAAVSSRSLKAIEEACYIGVDPDDGDIVIDVEYFFLQSKLIVEKYMEDFDDDNDDNDDDPFNEDIEGENTIGNTNDEAIDSDYIDYECEEPDLGSENRFDYLADYNSRYQKNGTLDPMYAEVKEEAEEHSGSYQMKAPAANATTGVTTRTTATTRTTTTSDAAKEYMNEIKQISASTSSTASRPQSAPAGQRAQQRGEITIDTFIPPPKETTTTRKLTSSSYESSPRITQTVKLPSSPYDEEVAFEHDGDEDDEELDSTYVKVRRNHSQQELDHFWQEENQRLLMASANFSEVHLPSSLKAALKDNANAKPSSSVKIKRSRSSSIGPPRGVHLHTGGDKATTATLGNNFNPNSSNGVGATSKLERDLQRLAQSANFSSRTRSRSADSRSKFRNSYSGSGFNHIAGAAVTSNKNTYKSSTEQLNVMKDLVEDLLRSTVKKADLYHMIQVNLGFIESYTMIPPRGIIIQSKKRDWFSTRDLQIAFLAARLCLTEPQLIILRSLIHTFAQDYDKLYPSYNVINQQEQQKESEQVQEASNTISVVGPGQTLSAFWLKKYLIHLRLTKKVVSAATTTDVPESSIKSIATNESGVLAVLSTDPITTTTTVGTTNPLPWKEWLGKKLQSEVKRDLIKPKEFSKALDGNNHSLSKDDVEQLLRLYNILESEILQQEIECRIESWLLDMDGRRDFQHELNVKLRGWIWNKVKKEKIKIPHTEKGYWYIWEALPDDQKKTEKANILNIIIKEKREELLTKERTKQYITKDLYWKFDDKRKLNKMTWKNFLDQHIKHFKKTLEDFRSTENDRLKRLAELQIKKKSVAGINEVQDKLKKVQSGMDTYHQIELQKAINALRRTAMINGVAKGSACGTMITKEDFDSHIKVILTPYLNKKSNISIPSSDTNKATTTTTSKSLPNTTTNNNNDISGIFQIELKKAVERVVVLETERTEKSKLKYQEWVNEKDMKKQQELKKMFDEEEKKKKQEAIKEKKSQKAYKKWINLRKRDKYKSMIDKKPHSVPPAKTIHHIQKWNNEVEMQKHYANMEKKF